MGPKGMSPKFQARVAIFGLAFETDGVDDSSVHAVGDGVTTLNRAPGIQLRSAKLRLLVRMPADAGRVEDDLRASERGEARAFGIPLVPADLYTDAGVLGVEIREPEVAGGEIKFFVIQRIVGDVH